MTEEDREYLTKRLHSPEMQCRQCEIIRALLNDTERTPT